MFLMLGLVMLASLGMLTIHERWVWAAAGIIIGAAMWLARNNYRLSWIVPVGFPFVGLYITIFVASPGAPPAISSPVGACCFCSMAG